MAPRKDALKAAQRHLGGAAAGENNGEPGDKTGDGAVDKPGEFTRRTYTLDEMQREALFDARADDRNNQTGGDGEAAFWRAAGDRLGFNPITVEQGETIADDGVFTAYPKDEGGEDEDRPTPTMERLERTLEDVKFDTGSMVFDTRDAMLEFIKRLPKPWGITPFDQQADVAAAVEQFSKDLVRKIVEAVRADGRSSIRALLVSYAEKEGINVQLKVKTHSAEESLKAVIALHQAQGKHVLIMVASADEYQEGQRGPELQPDQPGLQFEAGSDDHPDDDRDLSGEDEEQDEEEREAEPAE